MLQEHFKAEATVAIADLMGKRIEVYWSTAGARGWWAGTIEGYNPTNKTFQVRYDDASRDGVSVYDEYLLSPNKPKWQFI
jgi:hypothetical protein